jgi:translation initiation factor 2B subunit (eIF-2B alpha/beta/delta family)
MRPDLERRIAEIAADRESGASEILDRAIAVLRDASADDLDTVAAALRAAQPSMAPVWNATKAALATRTDPQALDRFARRVARAPEALARFAAGLLGIGVPSGASVRIVTFSYSRSVLHVLERLARERPIHVACAEGRPVCEGRRMASRLAAAGIPVTFLTDAAIGHALADADEVVVGADAITPEWFLNKSGTRLLAAAASAAGAGLTVIASRDKFLDQPTGDGLPIRHGPAAEVWEGAPARVTVQNPYFERVPLRLVGAIICDTGVLSPDEVQNMSV